MKVERIINEPTAAALAYGLDKEGEYTVAVLDLGGGTFDVTIMEMDNGVFDVISTSGDNNLGGTDMDDALVDYLADIFKEENGIDLRDDQAARQRLHDAGEKASEMTRAEYPFDCHGYTLKKYIEQMAKESYA